MQEKDLDRCPAPFEQPHLDEKDNDVASAGSSSEPEPSFEPIRAAAIRRQSRDTARSNKTGSLRREWSNNGYGCDDLVDIENQVDNSNNNLPEDVDTEKDPFEVDWDGEADPENPRNMANLKKWIIVAITSFGSFCV